jgi:hypothetical protein
MNIEEAIAAILTSIPCEQVFDDNYVVDRLFKVYPDAYLDFVAAYIDTLRPMGQVVSTISSQVEKFEGIYVEKQLSTSVSVNLNGVPCECAKWKRI